MSNKKWYKPIISNLCLTETEGVTDPTTIGHEDNNAYGKPCPDYCMVCGGCKAAQILVDSCSNQNNVRIPACTCGSTVNPS